MSAPTVAYVYAGTVRRWVDGDTVDLDLDLGFTVAVRVRVRLLDVDTAERGQAGYVEARLRAEQLAPVGSSVVARTRKDPVAPETFGRWLAEVWTPAGVDVAAVQRAAGAPDYVRGQ